ncbi:MAG: alpha/beta fold hydrolase [Clostridiales bacterium]|jgi:pimeloyl-ACP methyl ester carboxylesterase|nr:alpha/beta fold hydrolase [Clostridiales bacterium]
MSYLNIKGKKVHVIELNPRGEKTIIMIHGLFTNLSVYLYVAAPILAKSHRVILYDLRSHGLSERRDEGYTIEILADDLLALMDAMKIERAGFVGYSYGGTVSLYTALLHPERVERLALIETPLLNERLNGRLFSEGIEASMFAEGLKGYSRSTGIRLSSARMAAIEARYSCLFENDLLSNAFKSDANLFDSAPIERLPVPVLLLYGKRSEHRFTGQALERRIARSKLYVARGDHNLPVQRPRWLAHRLKPFFRQR